MRSAAFFLSSVTVVIAFSGSPLPAQIQNPAPTAAASPAASAAQKPIPPDSPKYGIYPIGYREIITRWLQERLLDPASAQLEWAEPKAAEIKTKRGSVAGYTVDFRVNSRNKFGMYTGFQTHRVLIRNGEIVWADRVRR